MRELKVKSLHIAQWDSPKGRTYSTLAVGTDGKVYRYDPKCEGWIAWSMKIAGCRAKHPGKR